MSGRSEKMLTALGIYVNRKGEKPSFSQDSSNQNLHKMSNDEESNFGVLKQTDEKIQAVLEINVNCENQNKIEKNSPKMDDLIGSCSELKPTEKGVEQDIENIENEGSRDSRDSSSSDESSSESWCSKGSRCSRSSSTKSLSSSVDDSDRDPDFNEESNESEESTGSNRNVERTRKRKRNPEGWKRTIVKKLRNCGKEYQSLHNGKLIPARKMLSSCKNTCRLKCSVKFTQEDREILFNSFWNLGNLENQRSFVVNHMQPIQPKYRHVLIERQKEQGLNKGYYFEKNNERKQVCFLFFRGTLGVSERFIRTVKTKDKGGYLETDLRGKGKHKNISEQIKNDMTHHLSSIPAVESHYTRANTQKKYIEGGKTVSDLYNDYVELCKAQNKNYGKISMYRYLFNYEFNMSFHIPKKDQCLTCNTYKNSNPDEKLQIEQSYKTHIIEKELSRYEKSKDKSKISRLFQVACFDLQAALPVPKGDVSSFYYKSRLNSYNFTICKLQQKGLGPVDCFFWHEGEAKRGASEIGTCLLEYLKKQSDLANSDGLELVLYSDNCGGQGKNKFIITAYLFAVAKYKIKSITHKFFVVGHGQNEGDASHSVIEKAVKKFLKSGPIYVPAHYSAIISSAKKKGSRFQVHEMAHQDFYDIKHLTQTLVNSSFNENCEGKKFNFNDIAMVKVERPHLDRFFYKTSYTETQFQSVLVRNSKTRKRLCTLDEYSLVPLYREPISISKKKFDDLQSLLQNKSIPSAHNQFFSSLKYET
ncbi:uncharacterized protein [Diabrotica undecimpunctata]|uniref:uncharacterized protein n=1 Tax=Diabrotica undecimpunctata TaxID=50387 RepID=UPI003B640474